MDKKKANISPCMNPAPNVLVSCKARRGERNALAVAYCCNCSYDPPMVMVGIVPSRHSYKMVKDSGCFVVNLVSSEMKKEFDYLGSHSGRDGNKLEHLKLKVSDGQAVAAPVLDDCPVNIECTVVDSIVTGSHEMFVGKIEYVHADASMVDEKGNIDFKNAALL